MMQTELIPIYIQNYSWKILSSWKWIYVLNIIILKIYGKYMKRFIQRTFDL